MATTFIDLSGKRFGNLTIIKRASLVGEGRPKWQCLCDCGTVKVILGDHMRRPKGKAVVSCGCVQKAHMARQAAACAGKPSNHRSHGASGDANKSGVWPEYRSWGHMRDRCNNSNHHAFHHYGGRGISYCERWESFENFYADMGPRPANTSLDRIKNDGNYGPDNCRWATRKVQGANKRPRRKKISTH